MWNRAEHARLANCARYIPDESFLHLARTWANPADPCQEGECETLTKLQFCRPDNWRKDNRMMELWIPNSLRWAETPAEKREEYLVQVAMFCFKSEHQFDELTPLITEDPIYVQAAERIIRDAPPELRGKAVGWMQVDPERLCEEVQALAVEGLFIG